MFHQRSSAFDRNISALEGRLHALENEIEKLGHKAGRRASAGMSAAGDQIGDAIAVAVNEIVDRFRSGRRVAEDEAVRLGNEAAKFGAKVGNDRDGWRRDTSRLTLRGSLADASAQLVKTAAPTLVAGN
jgi:hypothetical protein